jgi:hypothetical protein
MTEAGGATVSAFIQVSVSYSQREVFRITVHFLHRLGNVRDPICTARGAVLGRDWLGVGVSLVEVCTRHEMGDGPYSVSPRVGCRGCAGGNAAATDPVGRPLSEF